MVTYGKIIEAVMPMAELMKVKMKLSESIGVSKLLRRLREEESIYNEQRIKILKHYGKLNKEGNAYEVPEEKREQATKELIELINMEIDLGEKLKVTVNESNADTSFIGENLYRLIDFIDFVVEEGEENGK